MRSNGKRTNRSLRLRSSGGKSPKKLLVIDIRGSKIKILATGETELALLSKM